MGIEKTSDFGEEEYELTCDVCGKSGGLYAEFIGAVNAKKAKKWVSKKIGGLWVDHCTDCKGSING